MEVEGTNEEERSGKRAGLWRLGGAPGRGRGYGGEAGLTRAQFPRRGTRRPQDLRWSRAVAKRPARRRRRRRQGAPGAGPQQGEVEMWRWSGYLIAGG